MRGPGLGQRHYLRAARTRLGIPGGHHGLDKANGIALRRLGLDAGVDHVCDCGQRRKVLDPHRVGGHGDAVLLLDEAHHPGCLERVQDAQLKQRGGGEEILLITFENLFGDVPRQTGEELGLIHGVRPPRELGVDGRASARKAPAPRSRSPARRHYMFRRYCPPTSYSARESWPSVQTLQASISAAKMLPLSSAARFTASSASGAVAALRFQKASRAVME